MKERNPLRDAVQLALSASLAATVTAVPSAFAADDDVAEQDTVTVTGSRIKRVDIETPLPVTTINREDIDASGEISVAEVLRGSTFNSFGSFRQSSGSSAQSQATVSLRGLGSQRTLVLLDGRRIAGSPTFGAGSAQNLNTIPLAAVERIEVLRDGASAVYGSDAIGGVVNVILRKDFEGVHLSAGIGRPTQEGGDEESFGITGGISSGKGNITFSLDHGAQDIIFNGDREFSDVGLSSFGFPGTAWVGGFGRFADPRCPEGINGEPDTSDPEFPASVAVDQRCRYNYAGVSANEASIDRDSFFVNGNYEVSDNVSFFARGIFSRAESFGRYAPTPVVGGTPFAPTMSVNNPNNPTAPGALALPSGYNSNGGASNIDFVGSDFSQIDTDGDGIADATGPFEITSIWYRNVPGGFRDSLVENVWIDGLVGLQGSNDWFGGSDWEVGLQHSRQNNADSTAGLVVTPTLQGDVDSGALDIFAVNGPTDPAVARNSIHEGFHDEETRILSFDASMGFDIAQIANGSIPAAIGFDYRDEKFSQNYDGLQNAGAVTGSAGGEDITGARATYAVFGEVAIPILSNLELDLKVRRDHYNDFGNATTPQLSLGYRPMDNLLLRASFGEGFRAPSMSELYSGGSQSFNDGLDFVRCNTQAPGNVTQSGSTLTIVDESLDESCVTTQYQNIQGGNNQLDAEESEQFGLGAVWSPTSDLTLTLDYYDIELTNEITILPLNNILRAEFLGQPNGSLVNRKTNGTVNFIDRRNNNLEGIKTDGIDFSALYNFSIGNMGDFRTTLQVSKVNDFVRRLDPNEPFLRLEQTFDVDMRASATVNWARGDFGATLVGNHIADTAYVDGSASLSDWTTWDLQVSYATPWNGRVVVGARNVFDEDPPTDPVGLSNPYYSNGLHDIYGRVPYIRYEQDL